MCVCVCVCARVIGVKSDTKQAEVLCSICVCVCVQPTVYASVQKEIGFVRLRDTWTGYHIASWGRYK